jgi:hypothetical protein
LGFDDQEDRVKQNQRENSRIRGTDGPTETVTAQRETKLVLPDGESNLEALRSVTRDWLVPLLVEKFLREQGIELRARPNAEPGKTRIFDRLVVEGSATSRISPEADTNLPGGSEKSGLDRGAECQRMEKTTTNPLGKGGRRSTLRRE